MASVQSFILNSQEDVPSFLQKSNYRELLFLCNKSQLLIIAEYFELGVSPSDKKGEILLKVIQATQEVMSESKMFIREQLEIERLQLEKLKLERDEREREREREERERERVERQREREREERERERERVEREKEREREELAREREERERERERVEREKEREREEREKAIEREERERERRHELEVIRLRDEVRGDNKFEINAAIKLVPSFQESDVVEFFLAFEKIANQLEWPEEIWTTLIQCKFVGKAQKEYISLSEEVSKDYNQVKSLILKAYELVPEAYRLKFRELRKLPQQTYVEFSRRKLLAFQEWLRSRDINQFESLKELILLEEFKNCIPKEIKLHLDELEVSKLEEAARKADEYALAHKVWYKPKGRYEGQAEKWKGNRYSPGIGKGGSPKKGSPTRNKIQPSPSESGKSFQCFHCKKIGHVKKYCPSLKVKPVSLVGNLGNVVGSKMKGMRDMASYEGYIHQGIVGLKPGEGRTVTLLRDTGATQSLILKGSVPRGFINQGDEWVVIGGFPDTLTSYRLGDFWISSDLVEGKAKLAIVDKLPMSGVDVIVANDLGKPVAVTKSCVPIICEKPKDARTVGDSDGVVAAVTRSGKCKQGEENISNLGDLFSEERLERRTVTQKQVQKPELRNGESLPWGFEALIQEQRKDPTLGKIWDKTGGERDCNKPYFTVRDKVLVRVSRNILDENDECNKVTQIVVPELYRKKILEMGHEHILAGHFGVSKTLGRIAKNFFWPKLKKDIKWYVRSCHQCQLVGKPNQRVPSAPLIPIPVTKEPFKEILIDIVGPLPKTKSGYSYILTIMDRATRYPEAVPLRCIKANKVVEAIVQFFTKFGMPELIQSDCGTNFTSNYFKTAMDKLGIRHITSSPYHPQSQGSLERFHQTLKTMLKKYCMGDENNWDRDLPYLLFAIRSVPNDALGLSPFDLVFAHQVRGPLDVLREYWEDREGDENLLEFLDNSRKKLLDRWDFAKEHLGKYQRQMKEKYDLKTKPRKFNVGDQVLALLPVSGRPLHAIFSGPYRVSKCVSDVNYLIETPNRRKRFQLCHINRLKLYHDRNTSHPVAVVACMSEKECALVNDGSWPKQNTLALSELESVLEHLDTKKKDELKALVNEYKDLFKDVPGRTDMLKHDVVMDENVKPIKQHPYRMNPEKMAIVNKEVQYMLDHGLIQPSSSSWSSPVVLVEKGNGEHRLCFDYRQVNKVTKPDCYPIPRIEDCIDSIGNAQYITKFDMLKGYWQVGVTDKAREVSAFITPKGLYECLVMPFGMMNSACTFQRLMDKITRHLKNTVVYIDDVVIFSDTWEEHLNSIKLFFKAIRKAGLVINLSKCEFARATVKYLGHQIGYGKVIPKTSNVEAILALEIPSNKREIRRFLGAAGYFRKFIKNFAEVTSPLTDLLRKGEKFVWTSKCQQAFDNVKAVFINKPVLQTPDFSKPFVLSIDASDRGVGAILEQKDEDGVKHPVSYFSKKLNKSQCKYSTIEKEALALILSLEHFEVYLSMGSRLIEVWTDHNPLTFINQFKNKNQRLTRWSLYLQEWNLMVKHIRGTDNVLPDILSRNNFSS